MGTLRYGVDSYDVPDEDLTTLQFAIWDATRLDTGFMLELVYASRYVYLPISRGVPIALIIDTPEPLHRGDKVVEEWSNWARIGGSITIHI